MPNTEKWKIKAEKKWIGVDLDGTLTEYHKWETMIYIGPPIELMVIWDDRAIGVIKNTGKILG